MRLPASIPTLSTRDRRALAIGGLAASAMLATTWGWPAYSAWADRVGADAAVFARARAEVLRVARPTAADRATGDSAAARAARLATYEQGLVPGASPAAAAAELGSELRELADDAGLDVGPITVAVDSFVVASGLPEGDGGRELPTSTGPTPVRAAVMPGTQRLRAAPYVLVRANMDGTGLLGAVTALLQDVEAGPHRLRVRELAIDPSGTSGGGIALPFTSPAAPAVGTPMDGTPVEKAEPRLRLRIVVEGLANRPAPSRGTSAGRDVAPTGITP